MSATLLAASPEGTSAAAADLAATAREVDAVLGRVVGLDLGAWAGESHDAFATERDRTLDALRTVVDATGSAAAVLDGHARVLDDAVRTARNASTLADDPHVPWWDRDGATRRAGAAADDVQRAAHAAVAVVDEATRALRSLAPAPATAAGLAAAPGAERGGFWSELWGGTAESFVGLYELARDVSGAGALADPAGTALRRHAQLQGVRTLAGDPELAARALLDLDTWQTSPGRALGHLAPDALLTVATLGSGTVASRGITTAARVTERAASAEGLLVARRPLVIPARELGEARIPFGPPRPFVPPTRGLLPGEIDLVFTGLRAEGGHAVRHPRELGLIENRGPLAAQVAQLRAVSSPVLADPALVFPWRLRETSCMGYAALVDHRVIGVLVATDGPWAGKVVSAFEPTPHQLALWEAKNVAH